MFFDVFQTLWESGTDNGFRISDRKEVGKQEALDRIDELKKRKVELAKEKETLKSKIILLEKESEEEKSHRNRVHSEEVAFLSKTNLQLKRQLEGIKTAKD